MTTRTCPRCQTEKPCTEFHNRSDRPGQVQSWCKDCTNAHRRARHNRQRIIHEQPYYTRLKRAQFARIMGVYDAVPEAP